MLVIRRRAGQSLVIGDSIEIEISEIGHGRVKLGITAPQEISVLRKEMLLTREENVNAAHAASPDALRGLMNKIRVSGRFS